MQVLTEIVSQLIGPNLLHAVVHYDPHHLHEGAVTGGRHEEMP
jgi:hypothetical protein